MLGGQMLRPILACVLGLPLFWHSVQGARVQVERDSLEASGGAAELANFEDRNPMAAIIAAQNAERRRKEREEAAKRERERRERERLEAERKKREKEKHRRDHLQDCEFTEQWGEWGECSATCGGGIRTKELWARQIVKPQDRFGYGKPCPRACSPDTSACTSRVFRECGLEKMCSTDCSTVDLHNRLTAPGGAITWEFEKESGGSCVFQLWQVLPGAGDSPRLRLLGQTKPQGKDAPATVFSSYASGENVPYVLKAQGADVSFQDVAIGFRGCTLKAQGGDVAPAVARICRWGGEAFAVAAQTVELDDKQKDQLAEWRHLSRSTLGTSLARVAATPTGVGAEDEAVKFEGTGAGPGFAVRATMAAQPPGAPTLGPASADDAGVKIAVKAPFSDNGAALLPGFQVSVRRMFGSQGRKDIGSCAPVPLPACREGSGEPCLGAGAELVLRNLPLASKFEVAVAVQNAAGVGQPAKTVVFTRGNLSLPLKECTVDYWSCTSDDGEWQGYGPRAGDARCQLTAPPLPLCRMQVRTSWGKPKCDGKKYFRTCVPVLSQGQAGCAGPREAICVHDVPYVDGNPNKKCEAGGCSRSVMFWNQKTCCCLSEADTEDDSPNCACTKGKCADLGLVQAKNPNSCRH